MMRTLANEWGPLGIRVNCVSPGPIGDTEGMRRLAPTPELKARAEKNVPLRRFGTIQEIADSCLFLVSEASQYTTGAILIVDGGAWISSQGLGGLDL